MSDTRAEGSTPRSGDLDDGDREFPFAHGSNGVLCRGRIQRSQLLALLEECRSSGRSLPPCPVCGNGLRKILFPYVDDVEIAQGYANLSSRTVHREPEIDLSSLPPFDFAAVQRAANRGPVTQSSTARRRRSPRVPIHVPPRVEAEVAALSNPIVIPPRNVRHVVPTVDVSRNERTFDNDAMQRLLLRKQQQRAQAQAEEQEDTFDHASMQAILRRRQEAEARARATAVPFNTRALQNVLRSRNQAAVEAALASAPMADMDAIHETRDMKARGLRKDRCAACRVNSVWCFLTPCGHSLCQRCLITRLGQLADSPDTQLQITCPQRGCNEVLDEEFIKKLNGEEIVEFCANRLSERYLIPCPFCPIRFQPAEGIEELFLSAQCSCGVRFCLVCKERWAGDGDENGVCGNDACPTQTSRLSMLDTQPEMEAFTFSSDPGNPTRMIYKARLCPRCGNYVQRRNQCKHVQCTACRTHFCIVCVGVYRGNGEFAGWDCGWAWHDCGLARKQTVDPAQERQL